DPSLGSHAFGPGRSHRTARDQGAGSEPLMTGEGTGRRRRARSAARPFGVIAALAVVQVPALVLGWGGGTSGAWLVAWAAAVAAPSLLFAAQRASQTTPAGKAGRDVWRWFGIAALAWCAGATVNAASRLVLSRAAVAVSPADLFFLIAPVAMTAGFIAS